MLIVATDGARDEGWAPEIALGLARSWSGIGADVLVIDADPVDPTLHRLAHIENGAGISDALLFGSSIGGMAAPVEDGRFRVVPAGSPMADPAGAFARPRWQELIEDVVARGSTILLYSRSDAEWIDSLSEPASDLVLIALPGDAGIAAWSADGRMRAIYGIGAIDDDPGDDWLDPLAADPLGDAPMDTAPVDPLADPAGEEDIVWEDVDLGPSRLPPAAFGEALASATQSQDVIRDLSPVDDSAGEPVGDPWTDPTDDETATTALDATQVQATAPVHEAEDTVADEDLDSDVGFVDPVHGDRIDIEPTDPLLDDGSSKTPGWEAVDAALRDTTPDAPPVDAAVSPLDLGAAPWESPDDAPRSSARRLPVMVLGTTALAVAGWFLWTSIGAPGPRPAESAAPAGPEAAVAATAGSAAAPEAQRGSDDAAPPETSVEAAVATASDDAPPPPGGAAAAEVMRYAAAFGSFRSPETAERLRAEVAGQAPDALVLVVPAEVNGQLYHRVLAGATPTGTESRTMMESLAASTSRGLDDLVLREVPMGFLMGSTENRDDAVEAAAELSETGLPAYVLGGGSGDQAYRIMVGAFLDEAEAAWMKSQLESSGLPTDLVERRGTPLTN